MLTLELARNHRPTVRPLVRKVSRTIWDALTWSRGLDIVLEGKDNVPRTPALMACNSTHKYDPLIFRYAFDALDLDATTVSKGKNWHETSSAIGCNILGTLPVMSRGYILTIDVEATCGHRPDEALYRALRDHVDRNEPLPEHPDLDALLTTPRNVLGADYNPGVQTYRDFVRDLYHQFQTRLIELGLKVTQNGTYIHMYPQGSVSTRLSQGRTGAVQLAHALGIPIVPVGLSGGPEAFVSKKSLLPKDQRLLIRFGEPIDVSGLALPSGYRHFHPDDEAAHKPTLQETTDDLMERINALLDPDFQWSADKQSDGAKGTYRFV